jgi:hypothetical protein
MRTGQDEHDPHFLDLAAYLEVLQEARAASDAALERLHGLSERFPVALPAELLGQVEGLREAPTLERRRSPRLSGGAAPAAVAGPDALSEWTGGVLIDTSAGGAALLLTRPAEVGTTLLTWQRGPSWPRWLPAQVRHCRRAGRGWVVGVEFLRLSGAD